MKLKDRVAVITGGGSGIGRTVAILFATNGAKIGILDINDDGANETVKLITEAGGKACAYICNVSDSERVSEIIPSIVETHGGLDVLFNNAAFNRTIPPTPEDIYNVSIDHWNNVISVNLSGMLHLSKAA